MFGRNADSVKKSKYTNLLSIGDKIDMEKISNHLQEEKLIKYVSQVLDFGEDDTIHIAMPFEKGRLIPISINTRYSLCFYTKQGLLQCRCIVTDRYRSNNIYIVVVKLLSTLEKYQRRQYYRLECLIDITCRVMSEEELIDIETYEKGAFGAEKEKVGFLNHLDTYDTNYESSVLCDISGGGARLHSSKPMEKGSKIMINIPFPVDKGVQVLKLMAIVVSSENIKNKTNIFQNRIEFIEISKQDREFIVRYVFEEERKRRKKQSDL